MNSVRSKNLSLKYQRFALSGCKDVGIRKVCGKDSIPLHELGTKMYLPKYYHIFSHFY